MPGNHAFLSPSSSVRWYFCPPSARLCEQFPDQGSVYASEGTEAHALCEFLLKQALGMEVGMEAGDPRPDFQYYSAEMEEAAQGYVQYILEKVEKYKASDAAPIVFVEQRLDLRDYIPQSMGTADCVIIAGETAEVIDFKYGMHRVPASSMQLRIYALGVCQVFSALYDFSLLRTCVYQPRLSSVDEAEIFVEELLRWARGDLAPRARQAFDGIGEFACGDWCRMCRARRNCRALAEYQMEIAKYDFATAKLLTDEEIADILSRVDALVSWANDVKDYALREALRGHVYPGFKVVSGRAVRKFVDESAVAQRVEDVGVDPWERKLLGVSALEKKLGKKRVSDLLADLISRPEGKPVLVPSSDKRPELKSAEQDFAGMESEDDLNE